MEKRRKALSQQQQQQYNQLIKAEAEAAQRDAQEGEGGNGSSDNAAATAANVHNGSGEDEAAAGANTTGEGKSSRDTPTRSVSSSKHRWLTVLATLQDTSTPPDQQSPLDPQDQDLSGQLCSASAGGGCGGNDLNSPMMTHLLQSGQAQLVAQLGGQAGVGELE